MKFIFFGDYLKGLYRLIALLIIIVLIIPKIVFLGLELTGDERYIDNIYEATIEEDKTREESYFDKIWLDIKEFYLYGF